MALTELAIRNAKPGEKQIKLTDERGLFLIVSPSGGKWWRLRYYFEGKEKMFSLGVYPDVSLKLARERRDEACTLVARGIDPSANKKAQKAAKAAGSDNTFEIVAREWLARFQATWVPAHGDRIVRRFERDIFPWLGSTPVEEIKAVNILETIRRIENRGSLETAHRALQNCGQVMRYAVATGRAERDPTPDLKGALPPVKETHLAAITDPKKVAGLLRAIDGYEGGFITRCALRLAPMVFVRPGELRNAEWSEIDLDTAEWNIPAERMKMREPHLVPLSTQAVAVLRELYPLTGSSSFVFPGARTNGRPMSDAAINAALRRMGFEADEMTGHGFRAMARTILDEVLGVRPEFIEHQLAHAVRDPNGRAYNRTAHLGERKKMMQQWADYLDKLKAGAEIINLHNAA